MANELIPPLHWLVAHKWIISGTKAWTSPLLVPLKLETEAFPTQFVTGTESLWLPRKSLIISHTHTCTHTFFMIVILKKTSPFYSTSWLEDVFIMWLSQCFTRGRPSWLCIKMDGKNLQFAIVFQTNFRWCRELFLMDRQKPIDFIAAVVAQKLAWCSHGSMLPIPTVGRRMCKLKAQLCSDCSQRSMRLYERHEIAS